jgi:hypothetical protein
LDDNGMAQLVKQPTRGSNTLDIVVTNHPDSFRRVEALTVLSDHDIVFIEVNINPKKSIQKPRNIPAFRILLALSMLILNSSYPLSFAVFGL